ncbi:hypothetical protein B6I21_02770 [candidate division KSB1 bacterium 4572_119]|nr:MAG: hypothetical protein B6I21_02770 [candidate division KSB1 bacterium 4572_119]
MSEQLSGDDKNKFLFSMLIMNYQTSAMINMGKLKDPVSQKEVKNLEMAKLAIDTLEMLEEKTKNNLQKEESDLLADILKEMRLAYIKESSAEEKGVDS